VTIPASPGSQATAPPASRGMDGAAKRGIEQRGGKAPMHGSDWIVVAFSRSALDLGQSGFEANGPGVKQRTATQAAFCGDLSWID
jgi:hypothetical protein